MVKFINVSQDYGHFRALYGINFEIKKGSLLAFLGPNGAGKSTTMSIMTGFRPPTEGKVLIDGVDIFEDPIRAKSSIGFLPEIPPLYPELTVIEYLVFIGELRGINQEQSKIRSYEILKLLKLEDREGALIKNLSKGLKQRVGIAQSIFHYPKLLVLDEPTVGLEPAQLIEFRQMIRNLAYETGMTVVFSTHIMAEAAELCDEVIIINEGQIVFEGSKDVLLSQRDSLFSYQLIVSQASEELLSHLKTLEYVHSIEQNQEKFIIKAEKDIAEKIVEETIKKGVGVKSLAPLIDTLEKVFLDLTVSEREDG